MLKALREQRAQIVAEMEKLTKAAAEGKRDFTGEETEKFEKLDKEQGALKTRIDNLARVEGLRSELNQIVPNPAGRETTVIQPAIKPEDAEQNAWRSFLRFGEGRMSAEELACLRALGSNAAGSATPTAGGYLAPAKAGGEFLKALRDMTGMLMAPVRVVNTTSGEELLFPTVDDTANAGVQVDENPASAIADDVDPTFGQASLKAYSYDSKVVRISNQLLQDSSVPVEPMINELLAERLGAVINPALTSGSGTGAPQGIVTGASDSGVELPTDSLGADAAVVWRNINAIIHSVSAIYRRRPGFGLMMADSTVLALKGLTDDNKRPLWSPGFAAGEPDRIAGVPYYLNVDMDAIGAGNTPIIVGDFGQFWVRQVSRPIFQRLVELYARYLQTGFLVWHRIDSRVMNTAAIKYATNAAS